MRQRPRERSPEPQGRPEPEDPWPTEGDTTSATPTALRAHLRRPGSSARRCPSIASPPTTEWQGPSLLHKNELRLADGRADPGAIAVDGRPATHPRRLSHSICLLPDLQQGTTSTHMQKIGVRQLQQNAAAALRRVAAGERLEVTDRGRPVAILVPATHPSLIESLAAAGRLIAADGDLLDLELPLRLSSRAARPSVALARLRREER